VIWLLSEQRLFVHLGLLISRMRSKALLALCLSLIGVGASESGAQVSCEELFRERARVSSRAPISASEIIKLVETGSPAKLKSALKNSSERLWFDPVFQTLVLDSLLSRTLKMGNDVSTITVTEIALDRMKVPFELQKFDIRNPSSSRVALIAFSNLADAISVIPGVEAITRFHNDGGVKYVKMYYAALPKDSINNADAILNSLGKARSTINSNFKNSITSWQQGQPFVEPLSVDRH
jgi:hypothetical protein